MTWILLLLGALFSAACGLYDGAVFSEGNTQHSFNVHPFHLPLRFVGFASILLACGIHTPAQYMQALLVVSAIYPFFHNGIYYETRRRIDVKHYRFWSTSKTSTAVLNFTFPERAIALGAGAIIYVL